MDRDPRGVGGACDRHKSHHAVIRIEMNLNPNPSPLDVGRPKKLSELLTNISTSRGSRPSFRKHNTLATDEIGAGLDELGHANEFWGAHLYWH